MSESSVSRRYAKAMIEVATEADAADRVHQDLQTFVRAVDSGGGELRRALITPVFTADERQTVLDHVLPRLGLHPLTSNLLRLLNEKGRLGAIDDIVRVYGNLADERAGRVQVEVVTAEPMTPQIEAEVRTALAATTGKLVVIHARVDPSLIGGMVARIGGKVYDSSIKTRLEQLEQSLVSSSIGQA